MSSYREKLARGEIEYGPGTRGARGKIIYANPDPAIYQLKEGSVDPNTPVAGFYKMRLRKDAVFSAIKIFHGAPIDPATGETMDRGHRWQALLNGRWTPDVYVFWPKCAEQGISEEEYNRMMGLQAWAREHAPKSNLGDPNKPVDPLNAPTPF